MPKTLILSLGSRVKQVDSGIPALQMIDHAKVNRQFTNRYKCGSSRNDGTIAYPYFQLNVHHLVVCSTQLAHSTRDPKNLIRNVTTVLRKKFGVIDAYAHASKIHAKRLNTRQGRTRTLVGIWWHLALTWGLTRKPILKSGSAILSGIDRRAFIRLDATNPRLGRTALICGVSRVARILRGNPFL